MTTTLYKRLFEVRILHGYYLDGHSFTKEEPKKPEFFQDYPSDKQAEVLVNTHYNILNDLEIVPLPETDRILRGWSRKVIWTNTLTGFFVGLEVRFDGRNYFPVPDLPDGLALTFLVRIRNAWWPNFSNHALRPSLPGCYFFTNRSESVIKTLPSLALPVPDFAGKRTWEMGELARLPKNLLGRARQDTEVSTDFVELPDYQWASSADRRALPKQFSYRFKSSTPVKKAEFTLALPSGAIVKTITQNFTAQAPQDFLLDFSTKPLLEGQTKPERLPDGLYNLTVKINNDLFETRSIALRSELSGDQSVWGLIEIVLDKKQNDGFQLLEPNGALRKDATEPKSGLWAVKNPFEIRLLRRETWWHYIIENTVNSQLPTKDTPFGELMYFIKTQRIESTAPRPLLRTRAPVSINSNLFLPTPEQAVLQYDPKSGRYISQLYLQTIKLI